MTALDESRLSAAVDALRSQAGWCPSVASLPVYELQTLLSIAIRAYLKEEPTRTSTPRPSKPPQPRPAKRVKGPAKMPSKRELVLERDGRVCYLCERPIEKGEESLDHIVARASGGGSSMDNLRAAHKSCNRRKGQLPLEEFWKRYPINREAK